MSWDRDEAANQQEALDRLIESQRDFTDTMREHFSRDSGDGFSPPRGGEGGAGFDGIFDTQSITEFNSALRDSVGPLRVFARSIDMLNEKLEETLVQARDLQQAGSFNQQQKPNPQGAGSQQQLPAPPQFNTSNLLRPSSYMIPNQYGGFTMYNASVSPAAAASPITTVPSQMLDPGKVRRRQARRRSIMRKMRESRANGKAWSDVARGAYLGGVFGGVKGAIRGGAAGVIRMAASNPYLLAAGLVASVPFAMSSLTAAGDRQVDANRQYALAAPDTARALVNYDVSQFLRNMAEARATSGTAVKLIEAQDYARTQQQPFDILMKNTSNAMATAWNNLSGKFFELTNPLWEKLNSLFDDPKKGPRGDPALSALIGGAVGSLGIPLKGWDEWMSEAQKRKAIEDGIKEAERVDSSFLDMKFAPKVRKI